MILNEIVLNMVIGNKIIKHFINNIFIKKLIRLINLKVQNVAKKH